MRLSQLKSWLIFHINCYLYS